MICSKSFSFVISFKVSVLLFSVFMLSGCGFQNENEEHSLTITVNGIIEKNEENFFSDYVLVSDQGVPLARISSDLDIEKYEDQSVVVRGIMKYFIEREEEEIKKDESVELHSQIVPSQLSHSFFHEENTLPEISVFDIILVSENWTAHVLKNFTFSFKVPSLFYVEELEKVVRIFRTEEDFKPIITINKTIVTHMNIKDGQLIEVQGRKVYRVVSGNEIWFYFPEENLRIDLREDKKDLSFFYTILETFDFEKQEIFKNLENITTSTDEQNALDPVNDMQKRETDSETSMKEEDNIGISNPSLLSVLNAVVENKQSLLAFSGNSKQENFRITAVEISDSFVALEYKTENNKLLYKKLFSVSWKSIFLETLYFEEIAFWQQGIISRWDLKKGGIPNFEKNTNRFFLKNISQEYEKNKPENFVWYLSPNHRFSIAYAEKMYYGDREKDDSLYSVEWSFSPIDTEKKNISEISLVLLAGEQLEREELFTENTILIPYSAKKHFLLLGTKEISFSLLQEMANSLTLH